MKPNMDHMPISIQQSCVFCLVFCGTVHGQNLVNKFIWRFCLKRIPSIRLISSLSGLDIFVSPSNESNLRYLKAWFITWDCQRPDTPWKIKMEPKAMEVLVQMFFIFNWMIFRWTSRSSSGCIWPCFQELPACSSFRLSIWQGVGRSFIFLGIGVDHHGVKHTSIDDNNIPDLSVSIDNIYLDLFSCTWFYIIDCLIFVYCVHTRHI